MEPMLKIEFNKEGKSEIFPISMSCHYACNLIIWRFEGNSANTIFEQKRRVAYLMDRLADLLHDYQKFSPLVALIDLQQESDLWLQAIGDQDWHRGRFALQAVKSYESESIKDVEFLWLGNLSSSEYKVRKITPKDFTIELARAVKSAKPAKGVELPFFNRFTDALQQAVNSEDTSSFVNDWQLELAEDINNLLGSSVIEVDGFYE